RSAAAWGAVALAPLLLSLLAFAHPLAAPPPAATADGAAPSDLGLLLGDLEARAATLDEALGELDTYYRERVEPVEAVLRPFHEDELWVRRVAFALVEEAEAVDMDPRALASVLLVENPWLDPQAESFVGAVGL